MKYARVLQGAAGAAGMLVLILDAETALQGARAGLELCMATVIPSLFPFFVLSILLTNALRGMDFPLLRPLSRLCRIPPGMESVLLCGFLGGYPIGAQITASACRSGALSREEGQRMMAFCNQPGPSFLFGMVAAQFPAGWMSWLLWGILLLGAVLTAQLLPSPSQSPDCPAVRRASAPVLPSALRAMGTVCGWIILFRVIIGFLERWCLWLFPREIQIALCGCLELSNGCVLLSQIGDVRVRFVTAAGLLSFGGLCVTMQTQSVTRDLPMGTYLLGKGAQSLLCMGISWALAYGNWAAMAGIFLIFWWLRGFFRKRGSIPSAVGV